MLICSVSACCCFYARKHILLHVMYFQIHQINCIHQSVTSQYRKVNGGIVASTEQSVFVEAQCPVHVASFNHCQICLSLTFLMIQYHMNSDCVSIQHFPIGLSNGSALCSP